MSRARAPAKMEGCAWSSHLTKAFVLTMYLCVGAYAGTALQEPVVRYRPHLLHLPSTPCALSRCGASPLAGDPSPPQAVGTAIAEGPTMVATIWMLLATVETRFLSALIFLVARTVSLCAIPAEGAAVPTLAGGSAIGRGRMCRVAGAQATVGHRGSMTVQT